ncbi:MAG: hypothetical protein SWQ30_07535 [Thermodesulfobacteriota bacterium]|nr:hypothetical protein [Thermodesulfobacteriota bacterium]
MAKIAIKDLEKDLELDKKAMENIRGGWWYSSQSSMGWSWGPWGGGGWSSSSSSWGGGMWGPWGGGGGGNAASPWGGGNPWGGWGWPAF